MTRLALILIEPAKWRGGFNYLVNLVRVLHADPAAETHCVVFYSKEKSQVDAQAFAQLGATIVYEPAFGSSGELLSVMRNLVFGTNKEIERAFRRHHIDIIFESARYFGWAQPRPTLAWIPDMQHRLLPHMFGKFHWLRRELGFQLQARTGRVLLVSSQDAAADCRRFYGSANSRICTARFSVAAPTTAPTSAEALAERHGIPERYIYFPSQVYRHKNHIKVIESLALDRESRDRVFIVCTGECSDPRDDQHFQGLLTEIKRYGVEDQIKFLGSVAYADVLGLMQASVAVLNPSLFEGWSTTVEEAKLLGAPLILSDLEVHKEQAPPEAKFFRRSDPIDLLRALRTEWGRSINRPDTNRQAMAKLRDREFLNEMKTALSTALMVARS